MKHLPLAIPLLLLALTTPTLGSLTWPQRCLERQARPADETVEAVFAFRNEGEEPVTITRVTSSCGCTTAALDQEVYPPGKEGRITATFTLGERTGQQTKTILVQTDDPEQPVVRLVLQVTIPELIRIEPGLLLWRPQEPRTPRTVQLQLLEEQAHLLGATASSDEVKVSLEPVKEEQPTGAEASSPRRYTLTVTPSPAARRARLTLTLRLPEAVQVERHLDVRVLGTGTVPPATTQPAERVGE